MDTSDPILDCFPKLRTCAWKKTSPETIFYNCISWAVNDPRRRWWEPIPSFYWPSEAPRERTIYAYQRAFESCGFSVCSNSGLELGFEKLALYALSGEPQHAARQLPTGMWTSKLGTLEDISHETLEALEGEEYGTVVLIMRRAIGGVS